eukprot:TRINITY_DN32729_c0_g2_i2.p1 TRINITY_DN32729_c0_g2~~TRINITY_DN32729_c0_g2_i2.p1  ORF type:complete len:319 (+),score=67.68 TRINITY_DN32729_c0_g2_i2:74-958(+)
MLLCPVPERLRPATGMTQGRCRSHSIISEVDASDLLGAPGTPAEQLTVWSERLLAGALAARAQAQFCEQATSEAASEESHRGELHTQVSGEVHSQPRSGAPARPQLECLQLCATHQVSPQENPKNARACGEVSLMNAMAAIGEATSKSWGLRGMLGDAGTRWFLSSAADAGSSCAPRVRGIAVLCGSLEQEQQPLLREELRAALETVLTTAAGPDLLVNVCNRKLETALLATGDEGSAGFDFEVLPMDPNDRGPVLEVLRLEAQSGGARRLLPLLADSLCVAGSLRLKLEILAD